MVPFLVASATAVSIRALRRYNTSTSPLAYPLTLHSTPNRNVKLIQILHRHGDRSPSYNIYAPSTPAHIREADLWESRLPSSTLLKNLAASSSQVKTELPKRA